jgi:hypothetical protein
MLSVRLLTNTMKAMTLYNTLETFSFGGANYRYFIAFGKYINANGVTNILICFAIADFFYDFFCRGVCFGKVVFF